MVLSFFLLVVDIFHDHLGIQNDIIFDIDVHKRIKAHYMVWYIEHGHDYRRQENAENGKIIKFNL